MTGATPPLSLHPDRLLPADPGVRPIARRLYEAVRDLPVISPHGHVDPRLLLDDTPFADPATLFVTPDHYVTRLLHASGVPLDALGVGQGPLSEDASRRVWRQLCEHWDVYRGTPVRFWLEAELAEIFGIAERPAAESADRIYDQLAARLAEDAYRPRALYERFRIAVLATTDDPCDDLSPHAALAADPAWSGRVLPTFRPDRYLEPASPGWAEAVARLGEVAGVDTGDYRGYVQALERRRRHFVDNGAVSADHSHVDVRTDRLDGPEPGHDIPVRVELTDALRPLLERYGTYPGFHLVVYTVDETVWSRELAPLAGFYPSVYVGSPWWFLDAPEAIRRFRAAVMETAGFSRTAGFVDDTRAFCSIPARHDTSRRVDAGVLARLVAEHRLDEDEAAETAVELVTTLPTDVFKL